MKTRFAPSPTGWMHFGNLRTALFNFLYARKQQYKFLLRIEDTDNARSTKDFTADILLDLNWLHLKWDDGPYHQSERSAIYDKYYQQLEEHKLAYPCFCSEETLNLTRKVQMASGQPPRYPGTCRNLSPAAIAQKLQAGEKPTLRFQVPRDQLVEFVDLVKGAQKFAANDIGDFIIRRNDSTASFMFCNAIDDAMMGVTHALRGDDHLTNTPRQIMILQALKLTPPHYGHFAMINGIDGAPLSKRNGSETVRDLRAQGYHPMAVLNYLARLGHYYAANEYLTLEQLIAQFDLAHISTSPARHDLTHLRHWQREALLHSSNTEILELISPYLNEAIPVNKRAEFAELVKGNIMMPSDVILWVNTISDSQLNFSVENLAILQQAGAGFFAAALAALESKTAITFQELADAIKTATGYKGKALFMPLRVALTGESFGPELAKLMAFMPHELIISRFANVRTKYL